MAKVYIELEINGERAEITLEDPIADQVRGINEADAAMMLLTRAYEDVQRWLAPRSVLHKGVAQ